MAKSISRLLDADTDLLKQAGDFNGSARPKLAWSVIGSGEPGLAAPGTGSVEPEQHRP